MALEKVDLPDTTKMELALKYPELILSTPEEKLQDTALSMVKEDPELAKSQEMALQGIEERAQEGLTAEDRARYDELRRMAASEDSARQESILADMAQRGTLGSGSELAARLSSSQAGADRRAQGATQLAADASKARMDALSASGNLAANMSQSRYQRDANVAQARDNISQFNTSVAARDTAARRQQEQEKTNLGNFQQQYNKELGQRDFDNQMAKQGGIAQAYGGQAANAMTAAQLAQPKKSTFGAFLSGAVQGGMAGAKTGNPWAAAGGAAGGGALGVATMQDGGVKYEDGGIKTDMKKPNLFRELFLEGKNYQDGGEVPFMLQDPNKMPTAFEQLQKETGFDPKPAPPLRQEPLQREIPELGIPKKPNSEEQDPNKKDDGLFSEENLKTIGKYSDDVKEFLDKPEETPGQMISVPQAQEFKYNPTYQSKGVPMLGGQPAFADGGTKYDKMGYDEGGLQTEGRTIPGNSYAGDQLPDRINSGEMVFNLDQQQEIIELLRELQERRTDELAHEGQLDVNNDAQEEIMEVVREETPIDEANLDQNVVSPKQSTLQDLIKRLGK